MTNQTNSMKRAAPAQKSGTGAKAIIMAASLAATIGGWGILAIGQVNDTVAAIQQPSTLIQSAGTTIQNNAANQTTTLRQVTIPATQPRAIARTRSSR